MPDNFGTEYMQLPCSIPNILHIMFPLLHITLKVRLKTCFLVSNDNSKKITSSANEQNAKNATKYFCQAENITSQYVSFIWSFIRPPWAPGIMCCKRHVFNGIKNYCEEREVGKSYLKVDVNLIFLFCKNLCH